MSIGRSDSVVESSKVGSSGDEVDVEVGIVVLLEVDGVESVASEGGGSGKAGDDISDILGLCRSKKKEAIVSEQGWDVERGMKEERTLVVVRDGLAVENLDLDSLLGLELGNDDGREDLLEDGGISLSLETVVESVEVGSGDDVLEVDRLSEGNRVEVSCERARRRARRSES